MKKINFFILILLSTLLCVNYILFAPFTNFKKKKQDLDFWMNKFSSREYSTLFLGDSRVYRGLNSSLFGDGLNYAFSSNSYEEKYLYDSLDKCKRSCSIILGISGQSLTHYEGIKEYKRLKTLSNNPVKYTAKLLDIFIPNLPLLTNIPKRIKRFNRLESNMKYIYHEYGQVETFTKTKNISNGADFYTSIYKNFKFSKKILNNLKSFIQKNKKRVKFYFYFSPTSKMVYKVDQNIALSGYDEFFVKDSLIEAGAKYLDTKDYKFMDTYDGDHLDSKNSLLFSEYLKSRYEERK